MTQLATTLERRIELSAVRNFRDLGGYETSDGASVRRRTVFRSSTLSEATPEDVERMLDLNVGLVLDLRSEQEIARNGISPLHDTASHRHVPYRRHLRTAGQGVTGSFMRDHAGRGLDYLRGIEDALPDPRSPRRSRAGPSRSTARAAGTARASRRLLLRVLGVRTRRSSRTTR